MGKANLALVDGTAAAGSARIVAWQQSPDMSRPVTHLSPTCHAHVIRFNNMRDRDLGEKSASFVILRQRRCFHVVRVRS
jgi:hypothetical protein